MPTRQLLTGALVAFLVGWLMWSLLYNNYLGDYWLWPLLALTPESWRERGGPQMLYAVIAEGYNYLVAVGLMVMAGRVGRWAGSSHRSRPPTPPAPG